MQIIGMRSAEAAIAALFLIVVNTVTTNSQEMLIDEENRLTFFGKSIPDMHNPERFIRCEPIDDPQIIEPLPPGSWVREVGRLCPRESRMWLLFAGTIQIKAGEDAHRALVRHDFEAAREVLAAAELALQQALAPLGGLEGLPESQQQVLEQSGEALQRARGALEMGDREAARAALNDVRSELEELRMAPIAPEEEMLWEREEQRQMELAPAPQEMPQEEEMLREREEQRGMDLEELRIAPVAPQEMLAPGMQ